MLAEYIVSDDPSLDSSDKSSFTSNSEKSSRISTSSHAPETSSTDPISLNSDFVTIRRKQRKRVADEEADNVRNNLEENSFDFKRETVEEEINLINEIISQLSSSIPSDKQDKDASSAFTNEDSECLSNSQTSSPKRLQITMTFNRPTKCKNISDSREKQVRNKHNSTLDVIKQHNNLSHLKSSNIFIGNVKKPSTISDKNHVTKRAAQASMRKITSPKSKSQTPVHENLHKWMGETIISKSPNLIIKSPRERKKKLLKTPNFEKKASPMHTKLSKKSPVTPTNTPISRIPRPKKYFTTPFHLKTVKRTIETPTTTVIPSKRKAGSSRKSASAEKSRNSTSLNRTHSRSESSTPCYYTNDDRSQKSTDLRESLKNISVNLDSCMYDDEGRIVLEEKSLNSKKSVNKYSANSERNPLRLVPMSELMSGVGMLDSGITSKSDSKSSLFTNVPGEKSTLQEMDGDLNRAILESLSNHENSKKLDASNNCFDSMFCEKGSILSDSAESFLSLAKLDNHPNFDNDVDNKDADAKQSESPMSDLISRKDDSFFSVEEEYKYEDPEEGVVFLERRLCVTPSW